MYIIIYSAMQIETEKERSISRNLIVHKKEGPVQVSATLLLLQNSEGQPAGMVCVYNKKSKPFYETS